MNLLVALGPGEVELNWMWLPTWLGFNTALKKELEAFLEPLLLNKPLNEETFAEADERIVEFLEGKFPDIHGLRVYLKGISHVRL